MSSIVALNNQLHQSIGVEIPHPNFLSKGHSLVPVFVAEFALCLADLPLVFAKNSETGQIKPVAMLGLEPGENVFYSDEAWLGSYAPMSTRPSPLVAVPEKENSDKLIICIDEASSYVQTGKGELLFDQNGDQTEYLKQESQRVAEVRAHAQRTEEFVDKLLEYDLLQSNPIAVEPKGEESFNLTGLYVVNEKTLNELSAEQLLELRSQGFLHAVYASLMSLHRLNSLLSRRADQS